MTLPPARENRKVRSVLRNWLPNQHGAWFIVTVPALFGATLGGWAWQQAVLLSAWMFGFCFVFSALRLIKNPRRKSLRYPVLIYGILVGLLGLGVLVALPQLCCWIPAFALLIGVWAGEVYRGRERDLGARLTIILAAGLMTLVAYHCGLMATALRMDQDAMYGVREASALGGHALSTVLRGWTAAAAIAVQLTAYYAASVPYVKTIFRQRGNRRFLAISVVSHALGFTAALLSAALSWVSPLVAVAWLVTLARSIWFPWQAHRRGKPWRPRVIGLTEVAISVLIFVAAAL
ncbi:YwiC-like family protein [Mobiluncus curtisii]|uniref:YwiC-like family protein n=1 Tax=Mobiluncus curtisii TaxID=2051 RepID=UPI00146FCEBE|nr:YwiC-like family protein [Mobiluncus curtisii]MCV0020825.1 YwiC-like family protein [Mobiluncus curtisii]NMW47124.1 YwiC-like family protein [Mobiluncus curtisii]